ncbi:MAG: ATP-binding cassette domain-containing protein [Bacillota bacterium]|nr:ATP-binding cassette domain-containing protein [Bacillota bacterium]
MIKLEHISKTYSNNGADFDAIKDINLEIEQGEIFGIIGLSGAGKSTLVRCINYLEKPTRGKVVFDGKELGALSPKQLLKVRQSMGMIFQGFNLLSQRTALKNICFPLEIAGVSKTEAKKRALELLQIVSLNDKANAYPAQLSGGQKQRVAIARALATNPKVLLCDEATSALDPNSTRSILELLKSINEKMGVTIIIITHEMKVIEQICSRVAVIDQSKIVEIGDVRDVFLRPQSAIARELILPKGEAVERFTGKRCLRIIFDGNSAFEPIISNMALECRTAVNILAADTKNISGRAYGQMVLQLPEDESSTARIFSFLDERKVQYKEEQLNALAGNN